MSISENKYSVSVVIPAYNSAAHIRRAIDSVLTQTLGADEIIVVDDGSTDATAEVVASYGKRVKCISQENKGPGAARNTGIHAAKGSWIAFLDADDEWTGEKLKLQVDLLKRNSELMWVSANYSRCQEDLYLKAAHLPQAKVESLLEGRDYFENFLEAFAFDCWGHLDTAVIKREVLLDVEGFATARRTMEDLDLLWRIAYRWPRIGYVAEPLAVYHLDTPTSLIKTVKDRAVLAETIARHLELSEQAGKGADFKPCAVMMLRKWIRGMLFSAEGGEARNLIRRFDELLPCGYRLLIYVLTIFPGVTAFMCRGISLCAKKLKLWRQPSRSCR